jgi:predicted glycosyltransferase
MRRSLILLALLLPTPCAFAADWLKLVIPNTEDQYFYDRSKLVVHGSEVTYWKKVQFKQPQAVKNKLAHAGLMRERIDCKEHTLRLLSYLYHDAQGAVIEYVAEGEKEGAPIIPETVGDWFEQALCAVAVKETDGGKTPPKMDSNAL